ncbi:hypothetical protein K437DRAFT_257974 [Tilletiaria anomala UBC 951]|uniref:Arrestin-like N-terminal domain-containing protein n=1 Tax=Tilletiaria anomala (strain ATCC 24038 / CBS 436.72 / UBC 951) TaxID=1037660 RepID=A0A066VKC9_TILAU|nr:uncharacterized protein K437DRAFT_257974 [Tilletiaria anomala UBC 951]KDN42197.1 hypothetical protein K437DRAFT_257974 [Tilletiaria anomala UBC 951]
MLSFAGGAHLEQNTPFDITKVLEGADVTLPSSRLLRATLPDRNTDSWKKSGASYLSSPPSTAASSAGPSSPHQDTHQPLSPISPLESPGGSSLDHQGASNLGLEPGKVYSWDFIFEVPHESAPYERSKHGRLYQRVTAKLWLKGRGGLIGSGKKTLTAQKNVFFIALPGQDESLAYSFTHRDAVEHLGPLLVTTRSQHLTVGGYIRTALSLPNPNPELQILEASLYLIQTFHLHSRKQVLMQPCQADYFPIFESKGSDILREEEQAQGSDEEDDEDDENDNASSASKHVSFEGSWINKLPTDNMVRCSALPGSLSAIKPQHQFQFSLKYTYPGMQEELGKPSKLYQATWSVNLASCAARYENLRLPGYSAFDDKPVPETHRDEWTGPNEHESFTHCACGDSLEKLIRVEAEAEREQQHRLAEDIRQDIEHMRLASRSSSRSNSRAASRSNSRAPSRSNSRAPSRSVSRRPSFNCLPTGTSGSGCVGAGAWPASPSLSRSPSLSPSPGPAAGGAPGPSAISAAVRFAPSHSNDRSRSRGRNTSSRAMADDGDGDADSHSANGQNQGQGQSEGEGYGYGYGYGYGLGYGHERGEMDLVMRRRMREKERQLYEIVPPEAS